MPRTKARKKRSGPSLRGKAALITGAGRGIGLAVATQLAAEGCDLILSGRKLPPLEEAGRELARRGVRVLAKVCDVTDPDSVQSLAASVKKQFGRVDILINNAGIAHPSRGQSPNSPTRIGKRSSPPP